ncbi:class I tRNA ligase family protein, partial [Escherichia coli]|nr:class I tRNA ligase family protein [Escherichia coli]
THIIITTNNFTKKIPFKNIYITNLIHNTQNQKISKSKNNILNPLNIINNISLKNLITKHTTKLIKPKNTPKIKKTTHKKFPNNIITYNT